MDSKDHKSLHEVENMKPEDSEGLTPEEKIRKLQATVTQLKNVIVKLTGQEVDSNTRKSDKKKPRKFDFNLYCKRHVALHICYFGWDYHGFAVQETSGKTIESELFKALVLTKLIQCREESNYHRCGRTDKGKSGKYLWYDVFTFRNRLHFFIYN